MRGGPAAQRLRKTVLQFGPRAQGGLNRNRGYTAIGLLYGNVGQFVAQVVGAAVAFIWAFGASCIFFKVLDRLVKLRVCPEVELAGLDIPEMGLGGHIPDDLPAAA